MNLIIRTGSLTSELVARNVENLQPLIMIVFIQLLNRRVLRRETAAGRGVNDQDDFSLVV